MKTLTKYIALIAFALLFIAPAQAAPTADSLYSAAANAYANKQYAVAADTYAQIFEYGESATLYYNYANALLKSNQIGRAILNYERALRIDPNFENAKYNLDYANLQKTDKIETIEPFFITKWIVALRHLCTSDAWSYISICLFVLALVCVFIYLFSKKLALRKAGFFVAALFIVISAATMALAFSARHEATDTSYAIVMEGSVSVKSTPDASGTEMFVIHEGTKVHIRQMLGNWYEINIADGNIGWIESRTIEII